MHAHLIIDSMFDEVITEVLLMADYADTEAQRNEHFKEVGRLLYNYITNEYS